MKSGQGAEKKQQPKKLVENDGDDINNKSKIIQTHKIYHKNIILQSYGCGLVWQAVQYG